MIPLLRNKSQQKPLFHVIHEDDIYLLNTPDAEWFQILYHFRCERYLELGVQYYDALYEFNQKQAREREERGDDGEEEAVESKEEARQRLLFSRVTMQAESEIREDVLFEVKVVLVKTGSGVIRKEKELVGDTTHYYAYSGFETVVYKDESGKEQKKSQSRVSKGCRCEDKQGCGHPWELSDDGAGTIVKSGGKMYWGHKASLLGFPRQGIPLDARAIKDAAIFDGKTLYPHVKELFEMYPEIKSSVERVLYDSASPTFLVTRANRDSIVVRHRNVQSRISRKPLLLRDSDALS